MHYTYTMGSNKIQIRVKKSPKPDKKWVAVIKENNREKNVHFGQKGASDYTKHKDVDRMGRYIIRHGGKSIKSTTSTKENWEKNGYKTAGFWSRWLTWNKPTIQASVRDINKRFDNIHVTF